MNKKYIESINCEYLFSLDRDKAWQKLHKRDRKIYLEALASGVFKNQGSEIECLRYWQKQQLRLNNGGPGNLVQRTMGYLFSISQLLCLLAGFASMLSFLLYNGEQAINVVTLFMAFILLPWLCSLAILLLLKNSTSPLSLPLLRQALTLFSKKSGLVDSKKRQEILACLGNLWGKAEFIGLIRPALLAFQQQLAIAFNTGVIAAFTFKVLVTNLAFGWQSTLQLADDAVVQIVNSVALPWSWSGVPVPDLSQISGSRIVVKDGLYLLAQADLSSWWPFLLMSLLCYGLLPRLLLLAIIKSIEIKTLQKYTAKNIDLQNLLHRMRTPLFESAADDDKKDNVLPAASTKSSTPLTNRLRTLLVPYDLYPLNGLVAKILLGEHGFMASKQICYCKSYGEDKKLLASLDEEKACLLIMEAAMPPLAEFLSFVEELCRRSGSEVSVLLVGPDKDQPAIAITPSSYKVWQQKLAALGNPQIKLVPLSFMEDK